MIPLGSVNVGAGGASGIDFTNIPSNFQHLRLYVFARTVQTYSQDESYITFNGTSSNYDSHFFYGTGSSFGIDSPTYTTVIFVGRVPANGATANIFSHAIIDILDYSNTNKAKSVKFLSGYNVNTSGFVHVGTGIWNDLSVINSVRFRSNPNLIQYSSAHLYGIESSPASGA